MSLVVSDLFIGSVYFLFSFVSLCLSRLLICWHVVLHGITQSSFYFCEVDSNVHHYIYDVRNLSLLFLCQSG